MKAFKITAAVFFMSVSSLSLAEGSSDREYGEMIRANENTMREYATSVGKKPPEVVHYRYGMKLDIAKVIRTTRTDMTCNDVMPAQIPYEDSKGDLAIVEYRVAGTNCRR